MTAPIPGPPRWLKLLGLSLLALVAALAALHLTGHAPPMNHHLPSAALVPAAG